MLAPPWAHAEAAAQPALCQARSKPMARLELLFGSGAGGAKVPPRAFARFVAREITPRFPDGLSVLEAFGQWRDGSGALLREPSRLVLILYEQDPAADAKIEAIRSAYKVKFKQQSVMRVDGTSCVSF
ncbi:DUF3574 domain-containing protein [Methylocapsa acidiphila]|uniref:DUF3574 domain-containing protein n=1 Tax=Methylocapsa acidiphila TaxID=133552 RepID=UPI000A0642B3|nr:DUF3574 domain-containing protein [Methylocapsa acidiphila]